MSPEPKIIDQQQQSPGQQDMENSILRPPLKLQQKHSIESYDRYDKRKKRGLVEKKEVVVDNSFLQRNTGLAFFGGYESK